jgi:alpha-tubulin suppressor-like RCC1 family protein
MQACLPAPIILDKTKPVLTEVTAVITPSTKKKPRYTFNSTEAGSLIIGGSCASLATVAVKGMNTITFSYLGAGIYNSCTVSVKDAAKNVSAPLAISSFTVLETVPIYSSLQPAALLAGFESKISGHHLENATLMINGSLVTATFKSANEMRFIAPALPVGNYVIDIENSAGSVSESVAMKSPLIAKDIDAGYWHSCIVQENGQVKCWGIGSDYDGRITNKIKTIKDINTAVKVTVSDSIFSEGDACALLMNGTTQCWNYEDESPHLVTVTPPNIEGVNTAIEGFTGYHSCVVLLSGEIKCWGKNWEGGLGNNSTVHSDEPVTVYGITNAIAISGNYGVSCALLEGGTVQCWGSNDYGQLGNNTTTYSTVPVTVHGITNAVQISAGLNYNCATLASGAVKCWGSNSWGKLGDNSAADSFSVIPVTVLGISNAVEVSAGDQHTCARLTSGIVQCWGYNTFDNLSMHIHTSALPVTISDMVGTDIGLGKEYACVLKANKKIRCWGHNLYGELGHEQTPSRQSILDVSGISTAVKLSVSDTYGCAILINGSVKCWGANYSWQLGSEDIEAVVADEYTHIPVLVPGINNAIDIQGSYGSGFNSTCALLSDGRIKCWGDNYFGQLGNNGTVYTDFPENIEEEMRGLPSEVSNISTALSISVSSDFSCAVLEGGSVQCWGYNGWGRLGNGTDILSTIPVNVSGVTSAVSVGTGHYGGCALLSSGIVKCWGGNEYGQLGNGSTITSNIPVTVTGVSNAVALNVGATHSCAVLATGSVKCWGRNNYGQLGNGSFVDSSVPVVVQGLSNVIKLALGTDNSCAVLESGQFQCWGVQPVWKILKPGVPVHSSEI